MAQLIINNAELDISYQKQHEMRAEYSKIITNTLESEFSFVYETSHLNLKAKFNFAYQFLETILSLPENKLGMYIENKHRFLFRMNLKDITTLVKASLNTLTPAHKVKFEQEVKHLIDKIYSYGKLQQETYKIIFVHFLIEGFDIEYTYADPTFIKNQTLIEKYLCYDNIPSSVFQEILSRGTYTQLMNSNASALDYYQSFTENLFLHDSLFLHYYLSQLTEKKNYLETVILFSQSPIKKIASETKLYIEQNFSNIINKTPTTNLLRYAIAFNRFEDILPVLMRLNDAFGDTLPKQSNISQAKSRVIIGLPNVIVFEICCERDDFYYVYNMSIDLSDNLPCISGYSEPNSGPIDEQLSKISNQPIEDDSSLEFNEFSIEIIKQMLTHLAHKTAKSPLNLSIEGLCLYADLEIPVTNPIPNGIETAYLRKLTGHEVMPDETNVPCDFADLTPILHHDLLSIAEFQSIVALTNGINSELSLRLLNELLPRIIERTKLLILTSFGISHYVTEETIDLYTYKSDEDTFFYALGNPLATLVLLVRLNKLAVHGANGLQENFDSILNLTAEDPEDRMKLTTRTLKNFNRPIDW